MILNYFSMKVMWFHMIKRSFCFCLVAGVAGISGSAFLFLSACDRLLSRSLKGYCDDNVCSHSVVDIPWFR